MQSIPVIDLHADTYMKHLALRRIPELQRAFYQQDASFRPVADDFHITPRRLIEGGVAVQTQSLFLDDVFLAMPLHAAMQTISLMLQDIRRHKQLYQVLPGEEIDLSGERCGLFISIEGLEVIETNLDLLDVFYQLGVRLVAPSWNRPLPWAGAVTTEHGLLPAGHDLLSKMQELGMIVDISHLSTRSSFDIAEHFSGPIIASHSNPAALCNHKRNLSDDQLRMLAERDGIFGINFCPSFLPPCGDDAHGFEQIYRVVDYTLQHFGDSIIAIGSDFDGIASTPRGVDGPQVYQQLATYLSQRGISRQTIEKLFYRNALRLITTVL